MAAKRSVLCFVMLAKPLIEFGTKAYYSNSVLFESTVPCCNGLLDTENNVLCLTANFTLCKFHTVKNWYQFLRAPETLAPLRHIFRTNFSHFVKNTHEVKIHVVYMRILHIDKIPPKSAAFCIRFQFFTRVAYFINIERKLKQETENFEKFYGGNFWDRT